MQGLFCLIELRLTVFEFSAINMINSRSLVSIDNHNLMYFKIENLFCINNGIFMLINEFKNKNLANEPGFINPP